MGKLNKLNKPKGDGAAVTLPKGKPSGKKKG